MSTRLRFNTAREVFDAFPTAYDDITAEPDDTPPLRFLNVLAKSETPEEAITFCSYMLPRREAVWWAYQCVTLNGTELSTEERDLVTVAESWVREPDEDNRKKALVAGMNARYKTPGAWVALAAGWSGGSMVVEAEYPVPAPAHLTARAANAAVLSALARIDNDRRAEYLKTYVDGGVNLVHVDGSAG